MVQITITPFIQSALASLPRTSPLSSQSATSIDHERLIALSHQIKQPLHVLLRGTSVYHPPPLPAPQPSPEYLALKAHLLEQAAQLEYANLLNHNAHDQKSLFSITSPASDQDLDSDPSDPLSPTLVFNIFLSTILCAAAVFHLTRYLFTEGIRVLVCLLTAMLVGAAEAGLYAIYLGKVDRARRKERRMKEVKVLINEEGQRREGYSAVDGIGQKEDIWGRGLNGGVRRRVRERWEREQIKGMSSSQSVSTVSS